MGSSSAYIRDISSETVGQYLGVLVFSTRDHVGRGTAGIEPQRTNPSTYVSLDKGAERLCSFKAVVFFSSPSIRSMEGESVLSEFL